MNMFQSVFLYISSFILSVIPMSEYTEGVVGQPRSFLPSQAVTQTDKTVSRLIYRGLFKYDIYGMLVSDLAESWKISEDGLVYTIKLKDNQKWSDGSKITSEDLIYTAYKVGDLSGVATDRVDDLTVRYILPNKFSPFLSMLTVGVMPANAEEDMNPLSPVCSGPFRVIRIERSGPAVREITLIHNNKEEKIRKLSFRYYLNEEELVLGAKLGEVDGFLLSTKVSLDRFAEQRFPVQGVYYALFFNLRNEKFEDLEFRRKLASVIPVGDLTKTRGISVEGPISRSTFTDDSLSFDLYEEHFIPEAHDMQINITVPDIQTHLDLAKEIKELWEVNFGVDIDILKVKPEVFNEQVIENRDFEVLLYGQEVGRDPDRYINWHSTQKDYPGLNLTGFEHVRADRALEEGRNELDLEARKIHYVEFQKAINENVPALFLYHPFANYYVSKYIEGIGEKYTFSIGDRFLDFANWSRIETN